MTKSKFQMSQVTKVLAAAALMALAPAAFAASWDLIAGCTSGNTACTPTATPNVNISGWSTGTGTSTAPTAGLSPTLANAFISAKVYNWGSTAGLGVVAQNEDPQATGPHAADSIVGTDAFVLNFSAGAVNLTGFTIGWNGTDNPTTNTTGTYNDSDMSVFAWMGTGAPVPMSATSVPVPVAPTFASTKLGGTLTQSTSVTSGWRLVGNYADVGASNGTVAGGTANISAGSANIYSSYWLVSAYSQSYGGNWSEANDAFKLLSVAGSTCAASGGVTNNTCGGTKVPEPGSLALFGAALIGFVGSRRRKQQAA